MAANPMTMTKQMLKDSKQEQTQVGHLLDMNSQACPPSNETDDTRHSGSLKGHGPQLAENEPFL